MATRKVRRLLWTLAVCVLLLLGVKTFVGDVFTVTSSSMVPDLRPGEKVLVLFGASPPERFERVAVRHEGETVVKRACGLGGRAGESLQVDPSGDLRIDGELLPPDVPRPDPVLVFDDRLLSIRESFQWGDSSGRDPWSPGPDGTWVLDARDVERGSAGLMRYHRPLRDDHLDRHGKLVEGLYDVHDAVLEVEVRVTEPGGVLRAALVEQGDTFELRLDLSQAGPARLELVREGVDPGPLGETQVPLELGAWTRLRFANVDDHLSVEWGEGPPVLEVGYGHNAFHPLDTQREGKIWGERVRLGGEGCLLAIRGLRIYRDLHWTQHGQFGVGGQRKDIEPGQLFLLGDNSAESIDSRYFDVVPLGDVVGRPVWVVWPPSAIRRLR